MATLTSKKPSVARRTKKNVTIEDIFALFKEEREIRKEETKRLKEESLLRKEEEKRRKEEEKRRKEEIDRILNELKEDQKESRRQMQESKKELDKKIGSIHNSIGHLVEALMTPQLASKFSSLGYPFTRFARDMEINDERNQAIAEVDVFIENGMYAMAVEAKTRPTNADVKEHVERMAVLRRYANLHNDKRKFIGAIAAPSFPTQVLAAVHRAGFFAILPSEDSVDVIIPKGFKPREW